MSQKTNEFQLSTNESEALIFASTNPQYADIFFSELQVQYVKIPSSDHGKNMLCTVIDFDIQNNYVHVKFSPCFAKIKASNKDSPVQNML